MDDEGSDSRFAVRLPATGEYKIRVHAFEFKGGGNYVLDVRRFHAGMLAIGKPATGTFDREGQSYRRFQGVRDSIVIPDLKGSSPDAWKMLDWKGREMDSADGATSTRRATGGGGNLFGPSAEAVNGARLIEETGEHYLVLSGPPNQRYDLLLREARRHDLVESKPLTGTLRQGEMDLWSFQGKPDDFRLLEVDNQGQLPSRLVYAPLEKKKEQRLSRAENGRKSSSFP